MLGGASVNINVCVVQPELQNGLFMKTVVSFWVLLTVLSDF